MELDVPRDRNGEFTPRIVRKGQRRHDSIDKIVIGLYSPGMTVRDIQAHLAEIYEMEVSPDFISKITDGVLEVWDAGTVKNKAAHLAVGVRVDGHKEVLGIWVETTEGAKFPLGDAGV